MIKSLVQLSKVCFFAMALWGVPGATADSPGREVARFAALLPLTGSGSDQGEWCRRGLEIAAEEEKKKGDIDFSLTVEDTRGDPKTALDALSSLSFKGRVTAAFTWGSGVGVALTPIVNKKQIIQMGLATGTSVYRTKGDYTFRLFHSSDEEGKFLARVLSQRFGLKRIAVLWINNEYGLSIAAALKADFAAQGGRVVFDESYEPGVSDLRIQLLKLKAAMPERLVLVSYPAEGALALKQQKELSINLPLIASGAIFGGSSFFDVVGQAAEGLEIVLPHMPEGEALKQFSAAYQAKYPEKLSIISHYAARAYDGLKILVKVLRTCKGPDTTCMRDRLFEVRNYRGAFTTVSLDEYGDVTYGLSLFRVQGADIAEVR